MPTVMVVDDSLFVRNTMGRLLEFGGFLVLPPAASGEEAIERVAAEAPDLVLMDLLMGGIDGLETTRRILARRPTRIMIFSGATEDSRRLTLAAIQAGAVDFLPKPEPAALSRANADLLAAIARALEATPQVPRAPGQRPSVAPVGWPEPPRGGYQAVAVGVSTGGPAALAELLDPVPPSFPAPILIAQHMPAGWTQTLARQLDERVALPVREARPREELGPGVAYLAPGDFHLELATGLRARLGQALPVRGFRPSVDVLLESLARVAGPAGLAMVLTGMGSDGARGAAAVRAAGGHVLAQDELSSVVYGMPRTVAERGLASAVASPEQMGAFLASLAGPGPPTA